MSTGPLAAALSGMPAGRLVDRLGAQRMTIAGLATMALGAVTLPALSASVGLAGYVGALAVTTAGYALFQAANNTAVMTGSGSEQRGLVSGLLNLSRNLGLITGASLMGAAFALGAGTSDFTALAPQIAASGLAATFSIAAGFILAALLIAVRSSVVFRHKESLNTD